MRVGRLIIAFLMCGVAVGGRALSTGYIGIDGGGPSVRFTTGTHVHMEGLSDGRWTWSVWTGDGHFNFGYGTSSLPAFQIVVKHDPADDVGTPVLDGWTWIETSEEPTGDPGRRRSIVRIANEEHGLEVAIHTELDGTLVLKRWLDVTNIADTAVALTEVYPWSGGLWPVPDKVAASEWHPDPGSVFTVGHQPMDPGPVRKNQQAEGLARFEWRPLPTGTTSIRSTLGASYDDPFFIVRNEVEGEYFIGHLAWTANWHLEFEHSDDAEGNRPGLSFRIGPIAQDALRVLDPGETCTTPAVHLGHVEGDLDATVQAMHDHIRWSVLLPPAAPDRALTVQYDGGPAREGPILAYADVAARIGAEALILVHGWWNGHGDWTPSPTGFPQGLAPTVNKAHGKGLLFGMYGELEGGRDWTASQVYQDHPDWFLSQADLDLANPEVADYVEGELARVIDEYGLDIYAHEYLAGRKGEGHSTTRSGFRENNYWRYYDALYGIFERIRDRFPNVILQQSAAGSARQDLRMMSLFHESYVVEGGVPGVLRTYAGKTLAYPPESMLHFSWYGYAEPAHLETHLRVKYTLGKPLVGDGLSGNIHDLSPDLLARYLHYDGLYKGFIRPMLSTCKVFHHAPIAERNGVEDGGWFVMEFGAPDRSKGWALLVRIGRSLESQDDDAYLFRPRGLDRGRTYRVTLDTSQEIATVSGFDLVRDGILVRLPVLMSSELLLFEAN